MENLIHKGTVKLETERLILRRLTLEDADQMYENWANDDRVTEFLTWPTHKDKEITKKVLGMWVKEYENENFYQWGIELKETGELIGTISAVNTIDNVKTVEIGYCIGYNYWGKGYVPEALRELMNFFNKEVGYKRIEGTHCIENPKSGRVFEKCGFEFEGILRKRTKDKNGIMCDVKMYSFIFE